MPGLHKALASQGPGPGNEGAGPAVAGPVDLEAGPFESVLHGFQAWTALGSLRVSSAPATRGDSCSSATDAVQIESAMGRSESCLTRQDPRVRNVAVLLVAGMACSQGAYAQATPDEPPSVTPYRPSVSTPAALSAPGWIEVEAGLLHARGQGTARRDSLPYTVKLAFAADWGVRIGGDAWVRQTDDAGQRLSGGGDSSIVLKRRFEIDAASAFGLEAGATLPTGRGGIGTGKSDYSFNGIYSADLGEYHTDLNLVSTRVGRVDPGVSRGQILWAASLSKSLNDRWGVVGELSGTHQRGVAGSAQLLGAASYNVSKSLVLDAGLARSMRSGVPDWSIFTGFTMLAGRLF